MNDPVPRRDRTGATLTVTTIAGSALVVATGEFDCCVADRLRDLLDEQIAARPEALFVDMTRVRFCSARILRELLTASADAHPAGIPFAIVSDQRAVLRPIAVLGLDHLLQVHPHFAAAWEWVSVLRGATEVTAPLRT